MRNPSGYGCIYKMSGKRRRPWRVRVTTGWERDDENKRAKQIIVTLGYCATKKEAIQLLAEYNKNPYDLTRKDITFSEVYDIWAEEHFKQYPSTRVPTTSIYKYCAPLYDMRMIDIRLSHLQEIMKALEGKSRTTQTIAITIFKAVFRYCMENDILQKDYSQFVRKTTTTTKSVANKFFTTEEIKKVFANQHFVDRGSNYADVVLLLLYTGMRINEMLSIRSEDIDLEKRIIHVHGTKTEAAERIVPIHKDIIPLLEKRLADNGEYLIEKHNVPVPYMTFYVYWQNFMKSMNIPHTPHVTRHTFISICDECGITGIVLKRIVGHSNKNVTEHYTHKSYSQLVDAIDRFIMPSAPSLEDANTAS